METNKAQNTYQNADQNAALKDNQNSFHDNHSTRQDGQSAESPLDAIKKNVLKKSVEQDHVKNTKIVGFDFNIANGEINFNHLLANYKTIGFQATNFGLAIDIVNEMIQARNNNNSNSGPTAADTADNSNSEKEKGCKIFLGYTSNLVSSGLREMIRFLVQTNQVDVVVSSAGGIEEDFIKCLGDTYLGDFTLDGAKLRSEGLNRIGNLLVPNSNYCKFEDWVVPILDQLLLEQKRDGIIWTPSSIIKRLGKEINHPESIYYWAYKNDIPVYCPALTDGSLGDMIYFHSFKNPGLIIDIAADIRSMNGMEHYYALSSSHYSFLLTSNYSF